LIEAGHGEPCDDDRVITAGVLRQNAQTSLKGASAIVTAQTEPFPHGLLIFA
jgi:hypothetical protein